MEDFGLSVSWDEGGVSFVGRDACSWGGVGVGGCVWGFDRVESMR